MLDSTMQLTENQIMDFSLSGESLIDSIARKGAEKLLALALEREVEEHIAKYTNVVDEQGNRLVVRNGYCQEREILSGAGRLKVHQPRVNDKRDGEKFTSAILPPYMRKTPTIEKLIPALYLKGISTSQFKSALEAILGMNCSGLSSSTISDMMRIWQDEFEVWNRRDLTGKKYAYIWADGVHLKIRLGNEPKASLLVVMGATDEGKKELLGIYSGFRESIESWAELLRDFKERGLEEHPRLAVGDGALGFWGALGEVFPKTVHQRCWVHKTSNILDKMPKCVQDAAKSSIHNIYMADTKANALLAYDGFITKFEDKYPKAVACLEKSKEELLAFYDFPAKHWRHIRSTNIIESTFATLRHRTRQTKGAGTRKAAEAMAWKLCLEAEKHWKKLNGSNLVMKLFQNVTFKDGIELINSDQKVS